MLVRERGTFSRCRSCSPLASCPLRMCSAHWRGSCWACEAQLQLEGPKSCTIQDCALRTLPACECVAWSLPRRIGGQSISSEAALALTRRGVVRAPGRAVDDAPVGDEFTFAHDRRAQLPSPLYLTEAQIQAFSAATRCPVLVVRATDGLAFPEDRVASRMAAFAGDARQLLVPGHHHMHADPETAKAVADAVVSFLADKVGLTAGPAGSS